MEMITGSKNETVLQGNMLKMNPEGLNKRYRTGIIISDSDTESTTITYNAKVVFKEVLPSGRFLVSVTMDDFLINGFEPDLMMEQLAYKCRKPLEHVVFLVAANGSIENIYNHTEIVDKWFDARVRLELEYTGENFRKYITLNEAVVVNPDTLLAALKKDIFISQYFYPLYNEPFFNFTKKHVEKITFFNINYEIDVMLTVSNDVSASGNVSILKDINHNDYNHIAMPLEKYSSQYILNHDLHIVNIKGAFENYGRKYNFTIAEKYVG